MSLFGKRWTFIGPMGSGKSSLARRCERRYGGGLFDTDKVFTSRYGDIGEFFAAHGEAEFRKIETELLVEAAKSDAAYIATGGGAVLSKKGMSALRAVSEIVYLTAPTDVLFARIKKSDRPLKNKLGETIAARAPLYNKYADFTVDSSTDSEKAFDKALAEPRGRRYDVMLCDSDGTLLDFEKAMSTSVVSALRALGSKSRDDDIVKKYSEVNDEVWSKLERGEITRAELDRSRFRMLKEKLDETFDPDLANETYIEKMRQTRFVLDGALDFLRTARARGTKVYIITNSFTRMASERLKALNGYYDGAFISEEVGYDKPDVRYFERVYESIGSPDKNRVIVFGDSETADISGGASFGLDTCLYDPMGRAKNTAADYTVKSYRELLYLL